VPFSHHFGFCFHFLNSFSCPFCRPFSALHHPRLHTLPHTLTHSHAYFQQPLVSNSSNSSAAACSRRPVFSCCSGRWGLIMSFPQTLFMCSCLLRPFAEFHHSQLVHIPSIFSPLLFPLPFPFASPPHIFSHTPSRTILSIPLLSYICPLHPLSSSPGRRHPRARHGGHVQPRLLSAQGRARRVGPASRARSALARL
jgi:hypothetical protein